MYQPLDEAPPTFDPDEFDSSSSAAFDSLFILFWSGCSLELITKYKHAQCEENVQLVVNLVSTLAKLTTHEKSILHSFFVDHSLDSDSSLFTVQLANHWKLKVLKLRHREIQGYSTSWFTFIKRPDPSLFSLIFYCVIAEEGTARVNYVVSWK